MQPNETENANGASDLDRRLAEYHDTVEELRALTPAVQATSARYLLSAKARAETRLKAKLQVLRNLVCAVETQATKWRAEAEQIERALKWGE